MGLEYLLTLSHWEPSKASKTVPRQLATLHHLGSLLALRGHLLPPSPLIFSFLTKVVLQAVLVFFNPVQIRHMPGAKNSPRLSQTVLGSIGFHLSSYCRPGPKLIPRSVHALSVSLSNYSLPWSSVLAFLTAQKHPCKWNEANKPFIAAFSALQLHWSNTAQANKSGRCKCSPNDIVPLPLHSTHRPFRVAIAGLF